MTEGDEERSEDAAVAAAEEAQGFAGLADLDEDLSTMHQSNAEVERWRRLSTRGLTPAAGMQREGGGLAAPIISDDLTTSEMDAHSASTAPGTLTAPLDVAEGPAVSETAAVSAAAVAPVASADSTRRLGALTAEDVDAVTSSSPPAARKSFAPPKDTPSAPPGARVVLPASQPPERRSSRPVKVPRPSAPPPDEVRGWRASDPSAAPSEPMGEVAIPGPAPLPGAHRAREASAARSTPAPAAAPPTPPPGSRGERPTLDTSIEVSGLVLGALLLGGLALFFVLVFLLLL